MNLNNWKIYNKVGSPLNWVAEPYLPITFSADSSSSGASGYFITDPCGNIVEAEITNSGFYYTEGNTSVSYEYIFENNGLIDVTNDVSINYIDVSIFNPLPVNTQGIASLNNIDISANLLYPSVTYSAAIFLDPVSQGLVETEHLFIFEEIDSSLVRPYDVSYGSLYFQMYGEETEIQFFTVDEDTQEIIWTDLLQYDLDIWAEGTPISVNIGFTSTEEGVFERRLRIFNKVEDTFYLVGELLVNAEAIGEDERFRTLLSNFGAPDPKDIPKLFKEVDINEALPDWQVLNSKSKYMMLEHHNIMPFIGTYKGLVNAIDWLGYDDIYIREWFKEVKENKKLSLVIPFNADDRYKTILKFSPEERKTLKKLNQLSLNYCLNRETGEIDDWGTPQTENCYTYNIEEVQIKLFALKKWLEEKIIGVNARIIDLTGEGIYFERYVNLIYGTDNIGYSYRDYESLTPLALSDMSELRLGDASINLSLLEFSKLKIKDLDFKFSDSIDYVWNPSTGDYLYVQDPSYLADPSSYLEVGAPISHPFISLRDILWKASVSTYSGVLQEQFVSNPLWIYDNNIRFYNIFDSSSIFYDSSVHLSIKLENAYLRDASSISWEDSSMYSIYPTPYTDIETGGTKMLEADASYAIISGSGTIVDASKSYSYNVSVDTDPSYFIVDGSIWIEASTATRIESQTYFGWIMESSLGIIYKFDDYVNFTPGPNSLLQYAWNEDYGVPLLSFKNFKTIDASKTTVTFDTDKLYYLDIRDGKIILDASIFPDPSTGFDSSIYDIPIYYINYEYDDNNNQTISLNAEYWSPRLSIFQIDPSTYFWADPSTLSGNNDASILSIDNSIYNMHVNHIGNYNIEVFAFDSYNTIFYNKIRTPHEVFIKIPTLYALVDNSCNYTEICSSTYMSLTDVSTLINKNLYPIFERFDKFKGITVEDYESSDVYINAPVVTYFHELPISESNSELYNLTEKATSISGNTIIVDKAYQDFKTGDDINLVKFDKGSYYSLSEVSTHIINATGNTLTVDNIPSNFSNDISTDIYLLNNTERLTQNPSNYYDTSTFAIDISGYIFTDNQLVAVIVNDVCTGYSYASSFRTVSTDGSTHLFDHLLPEFIINNPLRYQITTKHSFSSFATYTFDISTSIELNNNFQLYYNNKYIPYVIDNTFVLMNTPFDFSKARDMWYDISLNLINSEYYFYDKGISIDTSTLIIFRSQYDTSILLNQKNIWTVINEDTSTLLLKVYNESLPIIFDEGANFKIIAESYDYYGNLRSTD
jgi:hypothetical protein